MTPHHSLRLALVLALALLGCEEGSEPTALRTATSATAQATSPEVAASTSDVTAQGTIALPINQSVATTAPNPAFGITQTGTGPDAAFKISNTSNSKVALLGQTNGTGTAVRGLATSTGSTAGSFEINNSASTRNALIAFTAGGGAALQASGSKGSAAIFDVSSSSTAAAALEAFNPGTNSAGFFVQENVNASGIALLARADGSGFAGSFLGQNTPSRGVHIQTHGATALEVVGGPATFSGNVTINGTLTKPAGSFRIDHPLDPAHRYLSHSFVESPDMLNIYNGNATLDGRGEAVVLLPAYFEALNRDFRYQLTPLGAPGPNLYVAEEISNNRFVIAGGTPGTRVSWQVTGVRQDAYAEAHRIQVEEDKPTAERGPK